MPQAQMADPGWSAGTPMANPPQHDEKGRSGGGSPLGALGGGQFAKLLGGGAEAAEAGGLAEALPLAALAL